MKRAKVIPRRMSLDSKIRFFKLLFSRLWYFNKPYDKTFWLILKPDLSVRLESLIFPAILYKCRWQDETLFYLCRPQWPMYISVSFLADFLWYTNSNWSHWVCHSSLPPTVLCKKKPVNLLTIAIKNCNVIWCWYYHFHNLKTVHYVQDYCSAKYS